MSRNLLEVDPTSIPRRWYLQRKAAGLCTAPSLHPMDCYCDTRTEMERADVEARDRLEASRELERQRIAAIRRAQVLKGRAHVG